jgi:ElaB/YqjD/DUF883 family membrane-anchored ribosome-binding protein
MNENNHLDGISEVPWPTSAPRGRVPDASMLPKTENTTQAMDGLLKDAVQGAHTTIDRLADSAGPAVQKIGESVSAAEDALHAKADQLRDTGDAWVESARTTVRDNPLVAIAAALTLGLLIARITR